MSQKTIAVIGAGIVGISTALWLQRDGHKVIVVDREGPAAGASFGNGGVLASCSMVPVPGPGLIRKAPGMLMDANQPLFLKWRYLPRLAPWLIKYLSRANEAAARETAAAVGPITADSLAEHEALARGTAAARYIVPSDYLYVYDNRAKFEADALGWGIRKAQGYTWEELDGDAFAAYDPVFAESLSFAVRMGNHGRISDPGAYVRALADSLVAEGGEIRKAEVTDFVTKAGRLTGIRVGGETIVCDASVLAIGAWSGPLARKLGLKVPLESERGYHLELWNPSIMPKSPVMVASGKFVATPMEGRLRLAGVVEFGGLDAPPSKGPVDLLTRNAKAAFPGITWSHTTDWMGHRPAPADSIPVIGAVPGIEGAFTGFGHHHIGLTSGPKTGRLLQQLISGRKPNVDLTPYSPARFAGRAAKDRQVNQNQQDVNT